MKIQKCMCHRHLPNAVDLYVKNIGIFCVTQNNSTIYIHLRKAAQENDSAIFLSRALFKGVVALINNSK